MPSCEVHGHALAVGAHGAHLAPQELPGSQRSVPGNPPLGSDHPPPRDGLSTERQHSTDLTWSTTLEERTHPFRDVTVRGHLAGWDLLHRVQHGLVVRLIHTVIMTDTPSEVSPPRIGRVSRRRGSITE